MMSADFDAFESSRRDDDAGIGGSGGEGGSGASAMGSDDPLAVFEPTPRLDATPIPADDGFGAGPAMGGVAGDGVTAESTAADGAGDLLGMGGGVGGENVRDDESGDVFAPLGAGMVEYDLTGATEGARGREDELTGDGDRAGDEEGDDENLLDMEGWNLRRHRAEAEAEDGECYAGEGKTIDVVDGAEEYGDDGQNDLLAADNTRQRNNGGSQRRGLFGWGSRRNQKADADASASDENAAPAWSDASSSNRGGGGLFNRRRNSSNSNIDGQGSEDSPGKIPRDEAEEAALDRGEGGVTGDDDDDNEVDEELEMEHRNDDRLRPGDHIYVWQTYGINPRAYQRHAVVFSVTKRGEGDPTSQPPDTPTVTLDEDGEPLSFDTEKLYRDDEDDVDVTVVSFYHLRRNHRAPGAAQAQRAVAGKKRGGCKRESLYDFIGPDGITRQKPVHKVRYGRKVKRGLLSQKAGVGTALKKDAVGLILARVRYVLDRPDHLPDHNALSANGECASLWCVTGRWCTLQGASILAVMSVGQAGGALLAGGILSNLTLLVPMPGVWGMAGWWWYVPATVAYPFLVPMLVTLGMASLVPLEILRRNRKRWRVITDGLNHEFWTGTSEEVRDQYFGITAAAEREAEMRSFFGVREGDASASADESKYMPLGGAPGGPDEEEEDEAMAMQRMEQNCRGMAADMNVDLSGKPPEQEPKQGAWGSFMGSFRGKRGGSTGRVQEDMNETQRFHASYDD
ncbi:hypothetical protein ACHAWF_017818 [Thalassiosira exigua]